MTRDQFLKAETIYNDIEILVDLNDEIPSDLSSDSYAWLRTALDNKIYELKKELEKI